MVLKEVNLFFIVKIRFYEYLICCPERNYEYASKRAIGKRGQSVIKGGGFLHNWARLVQNA